MMNLMFLPVLTLRTRLLTHALGLAALSLSGACLAAISPGNATGGSGNSSSYIGNGELFFSAYDAVAQASYTLDLGLDQNSFFINAQQDTGSQRFWAIGDAQWTNFLGLVTPANLRWSVLATDSTGGNAFGGVRLFMTARQGDEGLIGSMTNSAFSAGIGATQAGTFFSAVNTSGTHGVTGTPDYSSNGSSVNLLPDPGNGYYGEGGVGLTPTLNGNAPFDMSNKLGESSWFYYLTRSSTSQLQTVTVDEFDNGTVATGGHDGYWGFTKVGDSVNSPYRGMYLLSYTIESALPTATTAAGQLRANFLDYAAGLQSRGIAAPLGEFAGYQVTSLVVPSAVPEPATWGLFGLGLLGLALKTRQRRA